MKKISFLLLGLIALASCTSYKKVPYLQNSAEIDTIKVSEFYDARIQPKDMLTITVSSEKPEAAVPFNLTIPTATNTSSGGSRSLSSQPVLQTYLVDNEGNIDFPVLGKLQVKGMTKSELEEMIKERIKSNFTTDPIVTVRMANFKVTVLGEVNSPGVHTITNEKVNIFEALAMSGDLTVFGQRNNVKLIREGADGTKRIAPLNLNDANIIYSPYYYMQQNDILYVEPNKAKARNSDVSNMTSMWFSATSLLMAVVTFLLNLL
jgi:polysaccharide export outer membrane protein